MASKTKDSIKIKPSEKGSLRRDLKVKKGNKIPTKELNSKLKTAKKDKDTKLEKKLVFAKNARKWRKK
jgi:hypothetical protein